MDYTPELPNSLRKQETNLANEEYGPQAPSTIIRRSSASANPLPESDTYGPMLPLHLQIKEDCIAEEEDSSTYGPVLPPHLLKNSTSIPSKSDSVSKHLGVSGSSTPCVTVPTLNGGGNANDGDNSKCEEYGPSLPPHLKISSHCKLSKSNMPNVNKSNHSNHVERNDRTYGPVLPSKIRLPPVASDEEDSYCPALPPHLKIKQVQNHAYQSNIKEKSKCAVKMVEDPVSSEDEVYGPQPAGRPVDMDDYIEATLHQRTEATERRLQNANSTAPKREDWMLSLPEDRPLFSGLGLQARQFSKSGKRDRGDTSVWTDTPADKERKAKKAAEGRPTESTEQCQDSHPNRRDEHLQAVVDRHNDAKRPKPLIDTHQSKRKKAKTDGLSITGVGLERKPFSREEDLHVNKFDEAQKSSILKKARNLNDRFSSGKSSKFL